MEDNKKPEESVGAIKAALEKLNVDCTLAGAEKRAGGALEFEFDSEPENGLVFETVEDLPVPSEPFAENTEEKVLPVEKTEEPKEEFSLPESFEVSERYNTPSSDNEKTKIWTTYIPRFTDVSENYRMVNDPRPRAATTVSATKEEDTPLANKQEPRADKIDPTAEFESEDEAVEISTGDNVDIDGFTESLNVFKFASENTEIKNEPVKEEQSDSEKNDAPTEQPSDSLPDEAEDILDNAQEESSVEQRDFVAPPSKRTVTEIPDPTAADVHIVDYSEQTDNAKAAAGAVERYAPSAVALPTDRSEKHSGEYTAFYQRDGFKDKFLDMLLSSKIRLIAAILISVVLVAFENIGYLGVKLTEMLKLTATPWAVSLINLQLSLCLLLLALPEIIDGVKQLKSKVLAPEILLVPSFAVVAACGAINIVSNDRTPIFVGAIFAVHVIAAIYADSARKAADFSAFKSTSLNGEKKVIDIAPTKTLPAENHALDGAVDSYKSGTVRIFRASFVSDFFKRTSGKRENTFNNLLALLISLGVALVTALVCYFVFDGITSAAPAFATVYLVSVPAVSILLHKLPYQYAQRVCASDSSVIVGESALYEFEDADVITFEDTEIFGNEDVVLKRFMLYGDRENMTKAMRQMSSLFAVTGGPLDNIFSNALEKRTAPATGTVIEDDGVSGYVDGKRVFAGTYSYMCRHGIEVHSDSTNTENGADTTKIMYAAEEGVVYAKFYIRYSFSEEFSAILPSLRERKIVPLIYTRDPNISNELLKTLTAGQGAMRVLKRFDTPEEDSKSLLRVSAGVVSFGDKMSAIRTVLLAKKYSSLQSKLSVLEIIAMSVGCAAAVVLSILRVGIPSVFLALWHVSSCVALLAVMKKIFVPNKISKEKEEKQNVE